MGVSLKDAAIRAVRTFVQAFLGVYLAGVGVSPGLSDLGNLTVLDAAAAAGIVAVLTFVVNAVEDFTEVSALK